MEEIWLVCDRGWKPQCRIVIQAALVNIISTIWYARNQARFNNKIIHWKNAVSMISSSVSLSSNKTKLTFTTSMRDFCILKKFNVLIHPPKAPSIVEVIWHPPIFNWIKCNTDGASNNISSSCGGVFRNHSADLVACFAENLPHCSSLIAELSGAMRAIEIASHNNWHNLWLETDSSLVVFAKSSKIVPWSLKNRWLNCQRLISSMNFIVTHLFREGNDAADCLANLGLYLTEFLYLLDAPLCINSSLARNKLGMPCFRFRT
jgi:ribonuclease HI